MIRIFNLIYQSLVEISQRNAEPSNALYLDSRKIKWKWDAEIEYKSITLHTPGKTYRIFECTL